MTPLVILLSAVLLSLAHESVGQGNQYYYSNACGPQLQDIPNPASDSCTAFFRCYQNRQYSVRCPAGRAFDFNQARCRPANVVDCPLQLQRFQAPGIPHYLRPAGTGEDSRVEIRVVQLGDSSNPNNLIFLDRDGQQVPVTRQTNQNTASQSQIRTHPVNPYLTQSIHQSPVAVLNTNRRNSNPTVPLSAGGAQGVAPSAAPSQGRLPVQGGPSRPNTNILSDPRPNPSAALPLQ